VLTRLHHGVYRAGPLSTPMTVAAAAVLACGPGAALSHLWAAALWGIAPWPEGTVSVTSRRVRTRPGIRLHRTSDPDTTRHHGIPVTRPTRTLLDLATVLSARDLDRAVDEAIARRLTTRAVLDGVVRRHAGRPGAPALRATLRAAPGFTRSGPSAACWCS